MSDVAACIHGALMARVEMLALTPAVPVIFGLPATRPDGEHIEVHHLPNQNGRLFLGSKAVMDRMGILQLVLCSPLGQWERDYLARAGQIEAHVPREQAMAQSGLAVLVTQVDISRPVPDGTHMRTVIRIGYRGFA